MVHAPAVVDRSACRLPERLLLADLAALKYLEPHEKPGNDGYDEGTHLAECSPLGGAPVTQIHGATIAMGSDG